jgi:uncharacterized lipoprotein YmbA
MIRRRSLHGIAALLGALAVGCASEPPTRYYSLLAAADDARAATPAAAQAVAWQLAPVTMPAQVDRPQFVVRAADDSLVVLEQQRWIAPLAAEMHAALAERLVQRFGVAAAESNGDRGAATPLRVRVDVQRFDSAPGRYARLVADWSVQAETAPALVCRFEAEHPVGAGFGELAAGHRRAIAGLADAIAAAVSSLAAGRPARCVAASA